MKEPTNQVCPRCQAEAIMFPVEVSGYMQNPMPFQLKINAPKKAGALINFHASANFNVQAAVCGNCGYTEIYADKPNDMWAKWQEGCR